MGGIGAVTGGVVSIGVCVIAAVVGIFIQKYTTAPCDCPSIAAQDPDRCKVIELYMKVPLIATHLIPFILMPVSMWVCMEGAGVLQEMGMKSPVKVVLGLAYIMLSIAGEVGWHVHQRWFYNEDYDILNFFFYAFITLGTTFWALGAQSKKASTESISWVLDAVLMLCTPLTALAYGLAAYATDTKVPIYIIMAYQYGVLSWRLFKLLNNDYTVWLFPFFSVVVNLIFVFLLIQNKANITLNPLFHMLHDAAGTEMGILVITIILWRATTSSVNSKKQA